METRVLIVGGGLAGLALARRLQSAKCDFQVVEARDRFGGRIETANSGPAAFDLGPAWFWPGQPRIDALINELGLRTFLQYSEGSLSYEDERGAVMRDRGYASMQGSFRMDSGLSRLIAAIVDDLPEAQLHCARQVTRVRRRNNRIETQLAGPQSDMTITSNHVVLAIPPRVAARHIDFDGALPANAESAMLEIPTWMAGHAKLIAVYETPFWRDAGLSGDAMSRRGPLVEIHDASPGDGGPYALFGFFGVPAGYRQAQGDQIKELAVEQLERIFGPEASRPIEVFYKDWAFDPHTAIDLDHTPPARHPTYGLPHALHNLWDGQLLLASTETAPTFGGYLEGALEAAEAAGENVLANLTPATR